MVMDRAYGNLERWGRYKQDGQSFVVRLRDNVHFKKPYALRRQAAADFRLLWISPASWEHLFGTTEHAVDSLLSLYFKQSSLNNENFLLPKGFEAFFVEFICKEILGKQPKPLQMKEVQLAKLLPWDKAFRARMGTESLVEVNEWIAQEGLKAEQEVTAKTKEEAPEDQDDDDPEGGQLIMDIGDSLTVPEVEEGPAKVERN